MSREDHRKLLRKPWGREDVVRDKNLRERVADIVQKFRERKGIKKIDVEAS